MSIPLSIVAVLLLSGTASAQSDASTTQSTLPIPDKLDPNGSSIDPTINSSITEATPSESSPETTRETTETPTAAPSSGNNNNHFNYFLYCSCDLAAGQCDLNCCCDLDCSDDDRALFTRCWTPPGDHHDRMYCSRHEFYGLAWNNTPAYQSEHGGLLCVVTDNVPRYRAYDEKPLMKRDHLFRFVVPGVANRWTDKVDAFEVERWVYEPFYKEGSPLFTLHANGALGTLSKT